MFVEDPKLQFMESSLVALAQAQVRLAADLDRYRITMTPLIQEAAQRMSGGTDSQLTRQLLADSYRAQEAMRDCVRHTNLAYDAAMALHRGLTR